ncbi:MAG: zonular occludens toxin [Polaromonas sp.]|nr:zonular occludens toxin domain-containing protein [Polaromonas sp.]MBI2724747.1 zonular occludens toxin [Polaromonas sp.]
MINGLEGIPGSGKSYEAVVYHVLPMLQQGRKVITNLPLIVEMFAAIDPGYTHLIELRRRPKPVMGKWDADAMDDDGNGNAFMLFEDPSTHHKPTESVSVFGHVWDYYSTWKHPETGQGPVFIIDECHLALPTVGTSKEVVEFFKLHRHFNCDILLMTQSFRDINQPIARLMAMLVRCRKADILGKKDCYIRKVHAGYRGAVISVEERPYKKQYFPLYKSHTQGNSVAESGAQDVAPLSVKLRRFTWGFWIFTAIVIAWMFWPKSDPKSKVQKTSDMQWTKDLKAVPPGGTLRSPDQPAQVIKTATEAQAPSPAQAASSADPDATPEPYASKGIHLTGRITMGSQTVYTFAVSNSGQRISTIDSRDLKAMGYTWQPLTDCAGTLRWKGKAQAITCDSPMLAQGAQDRPVVVEVQSGRSSASGAGIERGYRPSSASPSVSPSAVSEAAAYLPGVVNPRAEQTP